MFSFLRRGDRVSAGIAAAVFAGRHARHFGELREKSTAPVDADHLAHLEGRSPGMLQQQPLRFGNAQGAYPRFEVKPQLGVDIPRQVTAVAPDLAGQRLQRKTRADIPFRGDPLDRKSVV